jgi:hypothetical protein
LLHPPGEFGAVAAYQLAAESGLLQKPVLDLAMQFLGQHKAHADLLTKTVKALGGAPAEPKRAAETLKTQTDVLRFAGLEQGAASGSPSYFRLVCKGIRKMTTYHTQAGGG